jgi:riboflavin synthase
MFTGIIEAVGQIEALDCSEKGGRLRVNLLEPGAVLAQAKPGDSIAVNGCCLTVTACSTDSFSADLSSETLQRTAFGEIKPGHLVNLERPLAVGARLGGHFVQGHIDGLGRVTRLISEGENWWLSVRVPEQLRRYVVEKGSMAIDGISLTVAVCEEGVADFAIIPFTYAHTNLRTRAPSDAVNVECDILAKYIEGLLETRQSHARPRLTMARLIEEGF